MTANHRRLIGCVGIPAFLVGVIGLAPGWWWHAARSTGKVVGDHWFPTMCFTVAVIAALVALWQWWRPWWHARPSSWTPITSRLPLLLHVMILAVLGITLFAGLAWVGWRVSGEPLLISRGPQSPTTGPVSPLANGWTTANTLDAIKILLSIVAGVGGVVALTIGYRKQDLGEAAEHREETKLLLERFGKAADQIGAEQAAVRIAGVYSMARLADEWQEGRQTCIDVLCAYLRMPHPEASEEAPAPRAAPGPGRWRVRRTDPEPEAQVMSSAAALDEQVRQTIVRLIRDHLRSGASVPWQRLKFDLTAADLKDVDFSEAVVGDGTELILAGTTLTGLINFRGLHLAGGVVDFISSRPLKAILNFPDAVLEAGTLDFQGVAFEAGTHVFFAGATFSGAAVTFNGNSFAGGHVSLDGAEYTSGVVEFSFPLDWSTPPRLPDPLPAAIHLSRFP